LNTTTTGTLLYDDAAAYLNLSTASLRRMVRANAVPFVRLGRRVVFPVAALDEWLTEAARASVRPTTPTPVPTSALPARARRRPAVAPSTPQPQPPAPRSASGRVRPYRDGGLA